MATLIIHSREKSPRLDYVAGQVFGDWYGIEVKAILDEQCGAKEYQLKNSRGEFLFASKSELLFSREIRQDFVFEWEKLLTNNWNTDWLGAVFFLLSRMEEYDTQEKDRHGRFMHTQSVAYQYGFLQKPLLDNIVHSFVSKFFPEKISIQKSLRIIPTLDIDMTHAVLGRPFWRQGAALLKDVLKGKAGERLRVLRSKTRDPYDNFDYQTTVFGQNHLQAHYFFQAGYYGKFDKNISPFHSLYRQTLAKLQYHKVGLHPSYRSMEKPALIAKEKQRLSEVAGREITASRQHFLRFWLPQTYRQLLENGITEEHSMGYSETVGFRAGTSRAFFWFDLEKNCRTNLLVQPFSVMDVALERFMGLSAEEAMIKIQELKQKLKVINGTFAFCFHNESLSERNQWKGWRNVFEELCKP